MDGSTNELERIVAELNRSAPASRNHSEVPPDTASLDQILIHAGKRGASDVLIIAGAPVTLRLNGSLTSAGNVLTAEESRSLLAPLLTSRQYELLQRERSVDFCFARESGRFRANIHHQRGTIAGSIRLLPGEPPTLESLHLPATLRQLAGRRQGLILWRHAGCRQRPWSRSRQ